MSYVEAIRSVLPEEAVVAEPEQLRTYECDGLTGHTVVPSLVALPATTEEVQAVVRACHEHGVPFVARGAGTGLSGGALPVADGVVISLARMNRILEVDLDSERVVVQPGVTNLQVTEAVIGEGYYYAPDPSSQQVCTIGGNVAENSGGAHCFKYGFTVNHVTGLLAVLPDGELRSARRQVARVRPGPTCSARSSAPRGRSASRPRSRCGCCAGRSRVRTVLAAFDSTDAAGGAVSGIVAAGILRVGDGDDGPADDRGGRGGRASGLPGRGRDPARRARRRGRAGRGGSRRGRGDLPRAAARGRSARATDDHERALLWKGRKAAFAAMGRVSADYYVQDGVVPRTKLPEVLRRIAELEARARPAGRRTSSTPATATCIRSCSTTRASTARPSGPQQLAEAILEICIDAGGSLTGEHGIGVDKVCSMPLLFGADDLEAMQRLRRAFDPAGLCNPGKVFPTPRLCGEVPGPYRAHPLEKAGLAERL